MVALALGWLVGETLGPRAQSVDEEARWPETGIRALQDAGLTALTIPKNQGGLGFGLLALAAIQINLN